jgi:hypothetical protein
MTKLIIVSIKLKDSFFCIYTGTAVIFPLEILPQFQDINPSMKYTVGILRGVVSVEQPRVQYRDFNQV